MSHQGPGGYGGGPPAGGPPGGGYGGYGGYGGGAPPGGPGQPPSPGYPPAQYPQQPPTQPGYAPPPKKKSNTALFVGIGCGVLLLLGAGAAFAIYLWTKDTINDAVTAASAFGAAVGSAPIVIPGVPAAPGATTPAPAGGAGTCERARICCEKILARSGNQNSALNCNALKTLPDSSCTQMLTAYTSMAAALGDSCQ
jgi:hypothetical protein